jgi:hypothetical protein
MIGSASRKDMRVATNRAESQQGPRAQSLRAPTAKAAPLVGGGPGRTQSPVAGPSLQPSSPAGQWTAATRPGRNHGARGLLFVGTLSSLERCACVCGGGGSRVCTSLSSAPVPPPCTCCSKVETWSDKATGSAFLTPGREGGERRRKFMAAEEILADLEAQKDSLRKQHHPALSPTEVHVTATNKTHLPPKPPTAHVLRRCFSARPSWPFWGPPPSRKRSGPVGRGEQPRGRAAAAVGHRQAPRRGRAAPAAKRWAKGPAVRSEFLWCL